jgi:hypothetical protein
VGPWPGLCPFCRLWTQEYGSFIHADSLCVLSFAGPRAHKVGQAPASKRVERAETNRTAQAQPEGLLELPLHPGSPGHLARESTDPPGAIFGEIATACGEAGHYPLKFSYVLSREVTPCTPDFLTPLWLLLVPSVGLPLSPLPAPFSQSDLTHSMALVTTSVPITPTPPFPARSSHGARTAHPAASRAAPSGCLTAPRIPCA